jgi:hypothetical protein
MTPKEKAQELFDKYYKLFNNFPNYQYVIENLNTIQDEKLYTAKQCSLIAVDEILSDYKNYLLHENTEYKGLMYWQEVKQEIEKL